MGRHDDEVQEAVLDRRTGREPLARPQDGETRRATVPALERLVPGFAGRVVTALFGGTYRRGVLDLRERQIATLAALTTLGPVGPQLEGHVRTAQRPGTSTQEIAEVVVHLAPHAGTPRTPAASRRPRAVVAP